MREDCDCDCDDEVKAGARQVGRPSSAAAWVGYLRHLARPVVEGIDLDREVEVALGNPCSLAGPLLVAARLDGEGAGGGGMARQGYDVPAVIRDEPRRYPDVFLWWGLVDESLDVMRAFDVDGDGPIIPQDVCTTIEVWTETELAALHALTNHAALMRRRDLEERIKRAVSWHIETTQPDNATNHCWAVNTFLDAGSGVGSGAGTAEAMHFAETLVSNCLVQNAQPDFLSAWILLDAARFFAGRAH